MLQGISHLCCHPMLAFKVLHPLSQSWLSRDLTRQQYAVMLPPPSSHQPGWPMKPFGKAISSASMNYKRFSKRQQKRLPKQSEEYVCRCPGLGAFDSQLTMTDTCCFFCTGLRYICHDRFVLGLLPTIFLFFFGKLEKRTGKGVIFFPQAVALEQGCRANVGGVFWFGCRMSRAMRAMWISGYPK